MKRKTFDMVLTAGGGVLFVVLIVAGALGVWGYSFANSNVHNQEIGGGKSYAQLSAAAMALPKGSAAYSAAEAKVQTVFQGTTLRGLLLEAYAFGTFGQIALVAAIVSFILASIMLLLTLFGLLHFRRVPEDAEFPATRAIGEVPVSASFR